MSSLVNAKSREGNRRKIERTMIQKVFDSLNIVSPFSYILESPLLDISFIFFKWICLIFYEEQKWIAEIIFPYLFPSRIFPFREK